MQMIFVTHKKLPFILVLCEESSLFDQMVYTVFSHLANHEIFAEFDLPTISSAHKEARKIAKILRSLGSQASIDSFTVIQFSRCYEFSKVVTVF